MKKSISEQLEAAAKATPKSEKIRVLHKNSSKTMKTILDFCFNPNIVWQLPAGSPPYKPQPKEADLQGVLHSDSMLRMLNLFVNNPKYANVKQDKREMKFIELLENVDPDDAKLILSIKEGKLPFKGLTAKTCADAFPTLSENWSK